MHYSRSFFASLAFHLLILALAWGAFSTLKKAPVEEERVAVSLATYTPAAAEEPVAAPPAAEKPQPQKPTPAPRPAAVAAPIPAPIPAAKPAPEPVAVKPAPAAVAAPQPHAPLPQTPPAPIRQEVRAAAAPPPAEERYEEENLGEIRAILAERLKYPKNALRLKQQGEVKVTFTLAPSKEVSNLVISQSSGFELLDDAARDLIESSAGAFPKPSKTVRITVPIGYKIR